MNKRISVLTLILAMAAVPAVACSGGGGDGGGDAGSDGGSAGASGADGTGGGADDWLGLPQWAQAYVPRTVELVDGYNFVVQN